MHSLRLQAPAALAVVAILTAAFAVGLSCSGQAIPDCGVPSLSETGTDGAPDPCHCDPPPALNIEACPCLSATEGDRDIYNACVALYQVEMRDAGGD